MLGLHYMKAAPTTYVIHHQAGAVRREGAGLAFFYFAPLSQISAIPLASVDLPFIFPAATADYQAVTIQGQITYRVSDPRKLASLLDFTVDPLGKYRTDDPDSLAARVANEAQILTNMRVEALSLKDVLRSAERLAAHMRDGLRDSRTLGMLGIEALACTVLSVRPTPEMARALEAEAREALQQEADQAIYARRREAVEQERRIKETELNTEIAVEEKKRQIRETQMSADIAVEERRKSLIALKTGNEREEADTRAYALEAVLKPASAVDWRTLMILGRGGVDARSLIALAFRDLAEHAEKIGTLNISPELLEALTKK
jgi:regulator of protease activity HflC (stomatin/prohibitin superfamily)